MKPHNATRTPAAPACQPDVVRGAVADPTQSLMVPGWVAMLALQGINRMVFVADRKMLDDERPWTQEDEDKREAMRDAQDILIDLLFKPTPRNTSCVCSRSSAAPPKRTSAPCGDV